ncbi:MAG: amidase, partial [Desulfobacterales bacterium]|nr:amidase [Desulfobacterales bacterium]
MSQGDDNQGKSGPAGLSRRRFMAYFSGAGLSATLLPGALAALADELGEITVEMIARAEKIAGLSFTDGERRGMVRGLESLRGKYERAREIRLGNDVPPALYFNPIPPGKTISAERKPFKMSVVETPVIRRKDLPFYSVTRLARLLETRRISSTELTRIYLDRLKKYDPILRCVVTLTEDLALKQARRADREIAEGRCRGPLHGIPWGAKDLFAVKGYKTTWGAAPFKDQVIDVNAAV